MIKAIFHALFSTLALAIIIFIISFWIFVRDIYDFENKTEFKSNEFNAIVVITGGTNRIDTAIDLWKKGYSETLYISGTHPSVSIESIIPQNLRKKCCVILDAVAEDTKNNASKTAQWLEQVKAEKFLLITSDYHRPRAELEFTQYLPSGISMRSYTVTPKGYSGFSWEQLIDKNRITILLKENIKYWGAWVSYKL